MSACRDDQGRNETYAVPSYFMTFLVEWLDRNRGGFLPLSELQQNPRASLTKKHSETVSIAIFQVSSPNLVLIFREACVI
jgi:hypothetical protein